MYFKAICLKPSVNLSCDYDIGFQDSEQRRVLKMEVGSWKIPLNHVLFYELSLQQEISLSCTCKCTSFAWKRDRHLAFYLNPIVGHESSLPSLRRSVLLLTRSEMRFTHSSSLISLGIAKTVANDCAQHAFIPFKINFVDIRDLYSL